LMRHLAAHEKYHQKGIQKMLDRHSMMMSELHGN
jgi:hypothetical protein